MVKYVENKSPRNAGYKYIGTFSIICKTCSIEMGSKSQLLTKDKTDTIPKNLALKLVRKWNLLNPIRDKTAQYFINSIHNQVLHEIESEPYISYTDPDLVCEDIDNSSCYPVKMRTFEFRDMSKADEEDLSTLISMNIVPQNFDPDKWGVGENGNAIILNHQRTYSVQDMFNDWMNELKEDPKSARIMEILKNVEVKNNERE